MNTTDSPHNSMRPQLWAFRISLLFCEILPLSLIPLAWGGVFSTTILIILIAAFIMSVLIAVISSVDIARSKNRKAVQAWVVSVLIILVLPIMSCGALIVLRPIPSYEPDTSTHEQLDSIDQPTQPSISITPAPLPTATSQYQNNGVVIPNFGSSSPPRGLSLKPDADFEDTFTGQRQFILTATNQFSGQAIGIYAVYTDACATQWQRYPDSTAPDHLAKVGTALIAGDLPYGEYQCIGLQLSAPLKVGRLYIGIESDQTGSHVEFAELSRLVKLIKNARPTPPSSTP